MPSIPPHISEQAKAHYKLSALPDLPGNLDDPAVAQQWRDATHPELRQLREALSYAYELEKTDLGGVPVYRVRTERCSDRERALLYFHGGGYVTCNPEVHATVAIQVAHEAGIEVLSVDYRKGPEHRYPAALDDALAVYRALLAEGTPASRVGVFGDSAGGGLCVALVLALRDAGDPLPGALAPISPWVDLLNEADTGTTLAAFDPDLYPEEAMQGFVRAYVGDADPGDPLISPVNADLSGLPPMLIQVGAREVLLSDSLRLARNARNAGVAVDLDVWDGLWHVFQVHPDMPEAQRANREIARFFRRHLR